MRKLAAAAALLVLTACGSRGVQPIAAPPFPADPYYASPQAAPRDPADELRDVEARSASIAAVFAASDLVFVGRVVHVARSPGVYSGFVRVTQPVLYEVESVWKGRAPDHRVVVHHLIAEPPMMDATAPRLSAATWREGARLVVSASYVTATGAESSPGGHGMLQLDATTDTVSADGEAAQRLRALVR